MKKYNTALLKNEQDKRQAGFDSSYSYQHRHIDSNSVLSGLIGGAVLGAGLTTMFAPTPVGTPAGAAVGAIIGAWVGLK